MAMSSVNRFARRLDRVERGLMSAQTMPRLPYSSIDSGALVVNDQDGQPQAIIGQQWDGTVTSTSVGGSAPASPTTPLAVPQPGGLALYWDGTYVDGQPARMDFKRVTFHAVTDVELLDVLDPAQIVGEITIATGGETFATLPPVEHFIFATTWTDAGKFSVESDVAFATPLAVVDPELWQQHEDALTELNVVTLPGLASELAERTRLVYAPVEPTGLGADDRVLWFDIDNGYTSSYWDGTAWGPYTLGPDALAASSIIASKIAADAVTSEKISAGAVIAGKVAADAITANEVAAGSITATELDVEVLRAGFTLTGRVQVGTSYWTPAEGLVIPQPGGGRIQLPADGITPARFDGHVNAKSATIEKDFHLMGATNKLSGQLTLAAGITEPTVPPAMYQSWPKVSSPSLDGTDTPWRIYAGACPHPSDSGKFVTSVQFGGNGIRSINKADGTLGAYPDVNNGKPWVSDFHSWGGIAYYGGFYYLYGQDGNRGNAWYVYKINSTTGDKVAEVHVTSDALHHADGTPAVSCNASGTFHIFYAQGIYGRVRSYDSNLNYSNDFIYNNYGIKVNHDAAYTGNADMGSYYWFLAIKETKSVVAFNSSGVFESSNSFAYASNSDLRGLYYDSTAARFRSFDKGGNIHTYSSWKQSQSFTGSYTWWDNVGTTRETRESPVTTFSLPARSSLNLETSVPPDSGNTDAAQVDKANMVKVYVGVGAGARKVQNGGAPLGVDGLGVSNRHLLMDTVNVASAGTPASNTFVGGATSVGKVVSGATATGQPILELSGDGSLKAGATSVATLNGQTISDTGWIALTLLNGWIDWDATNWGTASYRIKNGICYLRGLLHQPTAGSAGFTIANLPVAARPTAGTMFIMWTGPGPVRLDISSSGAMSFPEMNTTGTYCSISTSYPV